MEKVVWMARILIALFATWFFLSGAADDAVGALSEYLGYGEDTRQIEEKADAGDNFEEEENGVISKNAIYFNEEQADSMPNFRELNNEEQEALGIDSCAVTYLYSSGHYLPWMYWKCNCCDTTIVCRSEDVEEFLLESKNMKCPECGESAMELQFIRNRKG